MKSFFCLTLALFMVLSPLSAGFAAETPLELILKPFGQVTLESNPASDVYSFSASLGDLKKALSEIASSGVVLRELSVSLRDDGKAAISITAASNTTELPEHYRISSVIKLLGDKRLKWRLENSDLHGKYELTSFNTNLRTHVTLVGQTLKSGLIFSLLMPVLENSNYLRSPFFQRGTYSDAPKGERLLTFTVAVGFL